MSRNPLASNGHDPRHSFEETPWVVGYEGGRDCETTGILRALDELERLVSIGTRTCLLTSDGDRRVAIGRSGWSAWRDLVSPCGSGSVAYARMAARTNLFAWTVLDVSWNLRFEIDGRGRRPSILGAEAEMRRRLSFARSIVEAASSPGAGDARVRVMACRDSVMAAAAAQSPEEHASVWHQDDRVLGGVGGMSSAPEASLRLSGHGRRALHAQPCVLHVEHRRGMNPLKSGKVETVNLYAPVSLCSHPGDAMERLRALRTIPEGEVWWTR